MKAVKAVISVTASGAGTAFAGGIAVTLLAATGVIFGLSGNQLADVKTACNDPSAVDTKCKGYTVLILTKFSGKAWICQEPKINNSNYGKQIAIIVFDCGLVAL